MSLQNRKEDHIRLTVDNQSAYSYDAGFNQFRFRHNALPELDLNQISIEASFMKRVFSMPLFVSSMTGGFSGATQVNEIIAKVCENHNLPFGVGSQRAILENPDSTASFAVVRKTAPSAFIAGNIGGAQLIGRLNKASVSILIDSIQADALIVHLNPLQELMQPEGDRNFCGILDGIADLTSKSHVPVIVKETGAGISTQIARKLLEAGVTAIDIAGSGGTSWAKVENLRNNANAYPEFDDWGIPTTYCLNELHQAGIEPGRIIASGGVRSAHDMVKCICLGAGFTATAQPIIAAVNKGGEDALNTLIERWKTITRYSLLLLGCAKIRDLNRSHLIM